MMLKVRFEGIRRIFAGDGRQSGLCILALLCKLGICPVCSQDAFVLGETVPQLGKAASVIITRPTPLILLLPGFRNGAWMHSDGGKG